MARARELVSEEDTATRARLLLDEAWIGWRYGREEEMAGPAHKGLELARQTDDVALLSSALDAVTADAWTAGHYREAAEDTRERLELLAGERGGYAIEAERSDALHMMTECLVAAGDFREAAAYASQARDLDLSRGGVYSAWSRGLLPAFFLGEWDQALHMARGFRDAWATADHPPVYAMAAAVGSAGAILGYRGNDDAEDWFEFAASMAPAGGGQLRWPDADAGRRRAPPWAPQEAIARMTEECSSSTWWRSAYAATRAEALVHASADEAGAALAEAEQVVGDHGYAGGVLLRASAQHQEDEALLRESLAVFERIDCRYQAARTGWLLGGDARSQAERAFASLGTRPPSG